MKPPVTRLAPSPTGALHLGNARSFALTWWWARRHRAHLVLRIEDLESPRKKLDAIDQAILDLDWLGLTADTEPILQSSRHAAHLDALKRLQCLGLVYACICRRKDLEDAQDAPQEGAELHYPGTCRALGLDPIETSRALGRPIALRFRVPDRTIAFVDHRFGPCAINPAAVGGDFILARLEPSGRMAISYQLGVVVDDGIDGTTFVMRGDDLLTSVPRQRLLQKALGLLHPETCHLPLVVGEDGRRLAKRHGDTRLSAYREAGLPAAKIRAWIGKTAGLPERWWEDPTLGDEEAVLRCSGPIVVRPHSLTEGPSA